MSKITTPEQYEELANLMATKQDVACGYHKRSKEDVVAFWDHVANTLNALVPPVKRAISWKKVWIDWKCYIKKKLAANKKEMVSTGGGSCRLQRISPLEEKVIEMTGLVTNSLGISGAVDFGVRDGTQSCEMDISARSADLIEAATTSKKCQQPKENTSSLLKEQINSQKEFYAETKKFNEKIMEKYEEVSTHLLRMNRSFEKLSDIAAKQLEEQRRHNKIKEELLKQKIEIKLRMLKLEQQTFDCNN